VIAVLVIAFVLSGAAGLIYESIWTRYLGLFVGHSAYAQIIVLVIFLGGMSIGAFLAGQRSSRLKAPLLWYAGIEFVVGLMALGFDDVFNGVTTFAYASIFPATTGVVLIAVKWSLAGALILPQSILLGATFPLMSAGVIRVARAANAPGRLLALLYFANSIGAAFGVLLAGFVLIQATGLPGTLMVAAFINVLVAILVWLIARTHQRSTLSALTQDAAFEVQRAGAEAGSAGPDSTPGALWRPLLIVAFGTAVASFIYEIAWIRMLSLVLGSATHSFELMLSAFILGLALGALWIRRRADAIADPVRFLGAVQWVMGILAVATLPLYVASFDWISTVMQTVQTNDNGYVAFILARYAIALLIMLPATFCAGMTLPLITRVLMRGGAGERAVGAVYAVNTLGSIVGVVLAGLILMPLLGLKLLLIAGALADIALGVWLVTRAGTTGVRRLALAVAATAGLVAIIGVTARFSLAKLTSGVYRLGLIASNSDYTVPFYKDGRTASVSLRRSNDGLITLSTNGKPDASMDAAWLDTTESPDELRQLTRDLATQLLLPIVTLAHAPQAQNAAVIGFGSGMSSHVLLGSAVMKQVVTIEIEPEMINASRGFRPANHRAYDDPRSTFVIDDAKSYFASSGRKFDLVLSEPSNPWVSGVSGLFTLQFYRRVKSQLTAKGVFGQWLHLYELNDALATSVLAAIDSVFPSYEVFFTANADVLVVAANHELPNPTWSVVTYPGIAADLHPVVPLAAEQLEALRLGGRSVLRPMILAHGGANSDYYPVLDLGAERLRFLRENATGYTGLSEGRFDVVAALSGRRADFGRSTVAATPDIPRSEARALGANLHAMRTMPGPLVARMRQTEETRVAAYRLDQLERMAASDRAPTNWHRWIEHVIASDEDLHSGTAGVVDTAFFRTMRAYAARVGAPAEARASLDFLDGIGSWNWAEVVAATKLLETSKDSLGWVPDVLLRNGSVVAYIKLGLFDAATASLRTFAKRTAEDPFRERLLGSYLNFADPVLRKKMEWVK
jgi:predicted membrane-bound spermidine synthase